MKIDIQNIKTYYETQGDGDVIILLHGWGCDANTMRPILIYLRNKLKNAKIISMDFPGFGLSDIPSIPWTISDYVQHLFSFLNELGITSVTLLGHSFGGRIAIRFAALYPDRVNKLILVDSAGLIPKRGINYYFRVYFAKLVKAFNFLLLKLGVNSSPTSKINSFLGSQDYRNSGKMRATFVKVVNQNLKESLPMIKSKTLIIWGSKDKETPIQDAYIMKNLIPNSSLFIIKDAGHFSFIDNFEAFTQVLLPFLGDRA